jgi:opacity protein-like surface antigen
MTRTLIAAVTALALSFSSASAAAPQGYGEQSQTGAYAAGSQYSSTPLHEGGR